MKHNLSLQCVFFLVSRQYMLDKQQETFSHVRIYYKCSTNTFTDSSKSISATVERILIMFVLHRASFIASYCTLSCWLPINVENNNNCPQYIVKTSIMKWKYESKIDNNIMMSINVAKAVVSLYLALTAAKLEAKKGIIKLLTVWSVMKAADALRLIIS